MLGTVCMRRAGLYFTLHGELALVGRLDILAPMILVLLLCADSIVSGRLRLVAFTWEISSPPRRDLGYSIARSPLGGLALLSYKLKRILSRIIRPEGEISAMSASPPRRAGSPQCKQQLRKLKFPLRRSEIT